VLVLAVTTVGGVRIVLHQLRNPRHRVDAMKRVVLVKTTPQELLDEGGSEVQP